MLTSYPYKGLVEEKEAGFGGVVISATREEVLNVHRISPRARRYSIVKGWLDPAATMPPVIAACDDDGLVSLIAEDPGSRFEPSASRLELWRHPGAFGPLIAQCRDPELRRVLELALLRVNAGEHGRPTDPVEDRRVEDL